MNKDHAFTLLRNNVYALLALSAFIITALYAAWHANYYQISNSDNLVYPYLFQHFRLHDMVLPGQHSNILKFPLYMLQALLPYTFTTASIVNIGLVVISLVAWVWLLARTLGMRTLPVLCLSLGSILLISITFNQNFIGTTSRNVEYPIALAFMMYCGRLLYSKALSRPILIIGTIATLLYAATCAGDSFFIYTIALPLVIALVLSSRYNWHDNAYRKRAYILIGHIIGALALSVIIRHTVSHLGISIYYTDSVFSPHILPMSHLAASITTAASQLLDLSGANIFGQPVRAGNSLVFINFLLLLTGIVVMGRFFVRQITNVKHTAYSSRDFTLTTCFAAFFVTFIVYIASDLVVSTQANGSVASAGQERYLLFLPLLLIASLAYWTQHKAALNVPKLNPILLVAALLVLVVNLGNVRSINKYNPSFRIGPETVAQVAVAHHIPVLVTGYWYGASSRFWSHNTIAFASVNACNVSAPIFNNRVSLYSPTPTVHESALVIDRHGADSPYWQCTDQQLRSVYGTPSQVINAHTASDSPVLWVYDYDIRSRLVDVLPR